MLARWALCSLAWSSISLETSRPMTRSARVAGARQPADAAADVDDDVARSDLGVDHVQHQGDDLLAALPERGLVGIVVADLVVDEEQRVLARLLVPVALGAHSAGPYRL